MRTKSFIRPIFLAQSKILTPMTLIQDTGRGVFIDTEQRQIAVSRITATVPDGRKMIEFWLAFLILLVPFYAAFRYGFVSNGDSSDE